MLLNIVFRRLFFFPKKVNHVFFQAKGQVPIEDGEPTDLEAVKMLPDKLNSETEKEVQKKIEDMFAD